MLKIIITMIIFIPTNTVVDQNLNCEYLYFSGQWTDQENQICASEYKAIEKESIQWKRDLLEARWIY